MERTKDMTKKEKYIIDMLNDVLKLFPQSLTYGEFNKKFYFDKNVEKLRKLEEKYPELGLCNCKETADGVSILSLFATITHVFCGKRIGNNVDIEDDIDINDCTIKEFDFVWTDENWKE